MRHFRGSAAGQECARPGVDHGVHPGKPQTFPKEPLCSLSADVTLVSQLHNPLTHAADITSQIRVRDDDTLASHDEIVEDTEF